MAQKMKFDYAEDLKREIREAADEAGIDLDRPENVWSLWVKNGNSWLCKGCAAIPYVVYSFMGHFMLDHAIIFKRLKGKDTVKEFTAQSG